MLTPDEVSAFTPSRNRGLEDRVRQDPWGASPGVAKEHDLGVAELAQCVSVSGDAFVEWSKELGHVAAGVGDVDPLCFRSMGDGESKRAML